MFFLRWRIGRIGSWPPTIAVSTWSLRHEFKKGLSVLAFPDFVRRHFGVKYVEFVVNNFDSEEDSFFRQVAESVRDAGLHTVCLAIHNDFTVPNERLNEEITHASGLIRKAALLEAPFVRVNPGFEGDPDSPSTRQNVVAGLRALVGTARQCKVHLALENQGLFGMVPRNLVQVLEAVAEPKWLGACLDFGGFLPEYWNAPEIASLCQWAVHVHAKSYDFDERGNEPTIEYLAWVRRLRQAGFRGCWAVEYEGFENTDETAGVKKTMQLIQRSLDHASEPQRSSAGVC